MMSKEHKTFTREFKVEAVYLAQSSGKPLAQIARDLGIANGTLRHWRKQLAIQGEQAFANSGYQATQEEGMKHFPSDQQERENAFGPRCAMLRKSMGLTQRALGSLLGISEQAIQHWEHRVHVPKPEHLERLLALCLQHQAFVP